MQGLTLLELHWLHALNKSCGGNPSNCSGLHFEKTGAKCASLTVRNEMGPVLAPLQLGYGTPLGDEAAVHVAQT